MTRRSELSNRQRKAGQRAIVELLREHGTESEVAAVLGISQQSVNKAKTYGNVGYGVFSAIVRYFRLSEEAFLDRFGPAEDIVSFPLLAETMPPEYEEALSSQAFSVEAQALARTWYAHGRRRISVESWLDFMDGLERELRRVARATRTQAPVSPAARSETGIRAAPVARNVAEDGGTAPGSKTRRTLPPALGGPHSRA